MLQVLLSLLGLAAAEPQFVLPYTFPLVTPTVKASEDTPAINTYTATYPYAGFPYVQAALPYTHGFPYTFSPLVTGAKPAETTIVSSRKKRSADPEAKPDPNLVYTTGALNYPVATLPTTGLRYQYSGFPAAVNTYTYPQTIPYTGFTQYSGFTPFAGVNPYSTFRFLTPTVDTTAEAAAKPIEDSKIVRAKRSADPQLLTTGFTYPAVNTKTSSSAITYTNFPTTFTNFPTAYTNIPTAYSALPSIYTNSFPYQYGSHPTGITYVTGK